MYIFRFVMYKQDKNNLPASFYPTCTFQKLAFLLCLIICIIGLFFKKKLDGNGEWIPGDRYMSPEIV